MRDSGAVAKPGVVGVEYKPRKPKKTVRHALVERVDLRTWVPEIADGKPK